MLRPRIIPCLLVHKGGLVKTTGFDKPKYVGDPLNAVRIFNEKEVDELLVLDIDATREGRAPRLEFIRDLASECFMPLAYGGGVRTIQDASALFTVAPGGRIVLLKATLKFRTEEIEAETSAEAKSTFDARATGEFISRILNLGFVVGGATASGTSSHMKRKYSLSIVERLELVQVP